MEKMEGRKSNHPKSANITASVSKITLPERERRNGHLGCVLWLTGLSAAGKSTIANELEAALFRRGHQVFVLDGDRFRHGLCRDLGFSPADRTENIRRVGEVARLFADAGFICITAFISPYRADRSLVRALMREENFLKCLSTRHCPSARRAIRRVFTPRRGKTKSRISPAFPRLISRR